MRNQHLVMSRYFVRMILLSCISQKFPPSTFPLPPSNPSWDGRLSSPSLLYLTYLIIYCFILFLYNSLDRKHGPLGRVEKPERAFWFQLPYSFFLSLYDSALMEVFHSGELYKVVREKIKGETMPTSWKGSQVAEYQQ